MRGQSTDVFALNNYAWLRLRRLTVLCKSLTLGKRTLKVRLEGVVELFLTLCLSQFWHDLFFVCWGRLCPCVFCMLDAELDLVI